MFLNTIIIVGFSARPFESHGKVISLTLKVKIKTKNNGENKNIL